MTKRTKMLLCIAIALCVAGAAFFAVISVQERALLSRSERKTVQLDYLARITEKAKSGDTLAMLSLSLAYENGTIVPQDYKSAFEWLEKAAELNYPEAQNNLAGAYLYGRGTEKNVDKAIFWYEKAAAQGLSAAQFNLGRMYFSGKDIPKDEKKAYQMFTSAANSGHAGAANYLGVMYSRGIGVSADKKQAFDWYQKAADQNNSNAQFNLAEMLRRGDGVAVDFAAALRLYEQAAEDDPDALVEMGRMYSQGLGVEKDLLKAGEFYAMAADQKVESAKSYLDEQIAICMKGSKIDDLQAASCFLAAGGGHPVALALVGSFFHSGNFVQKDYEKSVPLFRRAAEHGDIRAMIMMGRIYATGEGVEKSSVESYAWKYATTQQRPNTDFEKRLIEITKGVLNIDESVLTAEEKALGLERARTYMDQIKK